MAVYMLNKKEFYSHFQDELAASGSKIIPKEELKPIPGCSPTSKIPCFSEYPGPYNFRCDIQDEPSERNKWLFSRSMNKLFCNLFSKVPVKFKWIQKEKGLQIRALIVFTSEDFREKAVIRCPRHAEPNDPSNQGIPFVHHVVRTDHLFGEYHKDLESKRLSVIVPVGIPTTEWIKLNYIFTCKNTCTVGMDRQSTAVIFTLERRNCEVIGRRILQVKICSCPKRDKEKEEKDFHERTNDELPSSSRKRPFPDGTYQRKRKYFAINPDGATVKMFWNKERGARMARYLYGVILGDAYGKRKLTAIEEDTLDTCKKIMSSSDAQSGNVPK